MGLFDGWKYRGKRKTRKKGPFRITSTRNGLFSLPTWNWGISTRWYKYSDKTQKHTIDIPIVGSISKRTGQPATRRRRRR